MLFDALQEKLLALVLPLILGPIVALATQSTKEASAWVDKQHAIVKQVIAALYATGFSWLASVVGANICIDGGTVCEATGLDWRVILTFAIGQSIHGWFRGKKKSGDAVPVTASDGG